MIREMMMKDIIRRGDKMKKLTAILCVLCLAGCSNGGDTKTTVCTADMNGVSVTNSFESNGDEITRQTVQNEMDYTTTGYSEEEMAQIAESYRSAYDVKGVEYSYEFSGNMLIENITIDFTEADFNELMDAELITADGENVSYISLEQTLDSLESSGFDCK